MPNGAAATERPTGARARGRNVMGSPPPGHPRRGSERVRRPSRRGPFGLGDGPCPGGAWWGGDCGTVPPTCGGDCGCGRCTGGWGTTGCGGDRCGGAWTTGGLTSGLGTGKWTGGTGTGASGGITTGTGTTGSTRTGAAGMGGAAGSGATGNGAASGRFNGLGAAIGAGMLIFGFGAAASTGAGAGACWVGTMRCWPGVGCKATVPSCGCQSPAQSRVPTPR